MSNRRNNLRKTNSPRNSSQREPSGPAAYPFTAIVGQDEMKLALVLNVIDPLIGGVLIMGHRGTGKSTAVRALADLLPEISIVSGCAYRCDPQNQENLCVDCRAKTESGEMLQPQRAAVSVAELPLGATEDRVCGTIAIERAFKDGVKIFEPGLLARANRGFLYIDEVNLLEDHLVDLLLDVAVTGQNRVERESISIEHPARFVLIGSGNPEEGELRPQLVDRFGLHAEVKTEDSLNRRVTIVERRESFDRDSDVFLHSFAAEQEKLRNRITRARKHFAGVKIERILLQYIAQLCSDLRVDGHRGEITIMRAARALTAFEGRKRVTEDDVKAVAVMSLRHRLRRDALEETAGGERINRALQQVFANGPMRDRSGDRSDRLTGNKAPNENGKQAHDSGDVRNRSSMPSADPGSHSKTDLPLPPAVEEDKPPHLRLRSDLGKKDRSGKSEFSSRQVYGARRLVTNQRRGRYSSATSIKSADSKIALDATLRAMLAKSVSASKASAGAISDAFRFKLFKRKQGSLFIFAIDTSGSMALNRIARARAVMLKLLRQSYLDRDSVAIVAFRGKSAKVRLPPSRSILRARRVLDSLNIGGSTPLSAGLVCTLELVTRTRNKHGEIVVLLFTDGHANVSLRNNGNDERALRQQMIEAELAQLGASLKKARASVAVVDTQSGFNSDVDTRRVADMLGACLVRL